MSICQANITDVDSAITVDIAFQVDLDILGNVVRTNNHGILAGNVVVLHYPEGVGAGFNASDGICGGVTLYNYLIIRFGVALGD